MVMEIGMHPGTWNPAIVPTSANRVVILPGHTVNINTTADVLTLNVRGTINWTSNLRIRIFGDSLTVSNTGSINAVLGGDPENISFINTSSTSYLENNGNFSIENLYLENQNNTLVVKGIQPINILNDIIYSSDNIQLEIENDGIINVSNDIRNVLLAMALQLLMTLVPLLILMALIRRLMTFTINNYGNVMQSGSFYDTDVDPNEVSIYNWAMQTGL